MKRLLPVIFLFVCALSFGQDLKTKWEKVAQFEEEGNFKKAAILTEEIYHQAKKEKNEPQIVKTFLFRAKYILRLEEEGVKKVTENLQQEMKTATPVTKALLQNIYATILKDYLRLNLWKINQHKPTTKTADRSILTWSETNFKQAIDSAYNASLYPEKALMQTPLTAYEEIIDFSPVLGKVNRPVYDFLAEKYTEHYKWANFQGKNPGTSAEKAFSTTDIFVALPSDITASNCLMLLQKLEKYYADNNNSPALQMATLRRIKFMFERYSDENTLYQNALKAFISKWGETAFTLRAKYYLASFYHGAASKDKNPEYRTQALNIANEIIESKTPNDVTYEAQLIERYITAVNVKLKTEEHIAPNSPWLANVSFANTDSLRVRLYKIPIKDVKVVFNRKDVESHPLALEKVYALPHKHDYFEYTTEIILPPVLSGTYVIIAEPARGKSTEFATNWPVVYCTGMSLTERHQDDKIIYNVYNRNNGAPIKGVTVNGKNTDANGTVYFPAQTDSDQQTQLYFSYGKDTITTTMYQSRRYEKYTQRPTVNIALYLDRAIYRPGQTVYYKGILYKNDPIKKSKEVVANAFLTLEASGPSGQLTELSVKTNQYGSFSGEFKLLMGQTGVFEIEINDDDDNEADPLYKDDEHKFWDNVDFRRNETRFRVEEYKRPTFDVSFNEVKQSLRLGDTVRITGKAKSFSTAPVAGAKVNYNIVRSEYEPYNSNAWFYDERMEENDIDNINGSSVDDGETVTDENGNFTIRFETEDEDRKKDLDDDDDDDGNTKQKIREHKKYYYTLIAEVTDINGESRRQITQFAVANYSLDLSLNINSTLFVNDDNTIKADSRNVNGVFTPAKGTITVYRKSSAGRPMVDRPWEAPEIQTITKSDFEKQFPYFPYTQVKDSVIKSKVWFKKDFTTTKETTLQLGNMKNWPSGDYIAYYTAKDSIGFTEEATAEFALQNPAAKENGGKQFQFSLKDGDFQKNGYATVQIATLMDEQYILLRAASVKNGIILEKGVLLTKGLNTIKLPISKNEDGYVTIQVDYIFENKKFIEKLAIPAKPIALPESLNISVERLNGIMAPGGTQNIKINLSPKSKRAEAELLASMYDTALDQFVQVPWEPLRNENYTYTYQGRIPDLQLLTKGSSNTYYYYSDKVKSTIVKKIDDYYTYGFAFNLTNKPNTPQYTQPKGQAPHPGDFLVTGIVNDKNGQAIPGASITISGSAEGVQADINGNFAIYTAKGETLLISFIGFENSILKPSGSGIYNVVLNENSNELEDVVVVGYGVQTKSNMTGSAVTVVLRGIGSVNYISTLAGRTSGIAIVQNESNASSYTLKVDTKEASLIVIDGEIVKPGKEVTLNENDIADLKQLDAKEAEKIYGSAGKNGAVIITTSKSLKDVKKVTARKNFNETAFFYPMLYPDKKGNISLNVTVPESLTEWKLRLLAHNKNAESVYAEKKIITRKELMVVPNMPRFLRETDTLTIKVKITNLTDKPKTGTALLQLYDAVTLTEVDAAMGNVKAVQSFSIGGNANTVLSWTITVPKGLQGVQYKVLAKSGDYSDGEENILPVLPNSILLTESIPLWVREHSIREYTFENLKNNTSTTLRNQSLVLEYTSNPAWLALQSLPYLMQYEHDCTEQLFSKFFAQSIACHIMVSNPKIKAVFDKWRSEGKPSRMDNDPQLRNTLLAETPWLLDMENKTERDYRLALLIDMDKIASAKQDILDKLKQRRLAEGTFPWFPGGTASPYISRYVVQSLGHLYRLNVLTPYDKSQTDQFIKPAIYQMDNEFITIRQKQAKHKGKVPSYIIPSRYDEIHYLYARSYFVKEFPVTDSLKKYIMPTLKWLQQNWKDQNVYGKAQAALVFHRFGYKAEAEKILVYLKGSSSNNTDWGMYWINNNYGWYWYNNPIETQTLAIEAFDEITHDSQAVDDLKVWLLKQKQNTHWPTTKSTAEAIYTLLATGSNFLDKKDETKFSIGDEAQLNKKIAETAVEAASGYTKIQWKPEEISVANATLKIENKGDVPGFGGFYWQYFEELDKIKPAQDGLMNISKELFHKKIIEGKTTLTPLTAATPLKTGQNVIVRMVLYLKEDAEFVHLKDMRASGLEPIDVLSGYKYKDGLSFYQSTRDVATHFFFDSIKRGSYVLEYELKVNNPGQFSNGITTLQSMYAPEFSAHTAGTRIHITE